jgi:hypothetical protein
MSIQDKISELATFFWVKILKFFDVDQDPGSGIIDCGSGIRGRKIRIRDKHPGSATLV